jgi:hypothetical protein
MKNKNLGILLLAVWLILSGLVNLLGIRIPGLPLIMGVLALAAGVLLIIGK